MFLRLARMSLACAAVVTVRPAIGASTDTLLGKAASGDAVYYALLGDAGSVKTVQTRLVYAQSRVVGDVSNVVVSLSVEQIDCKLFTRKTVRLELYTSAAPGATPAWTKELDPAQESPTAVDLTASTAPPAPPPMSVPAPVSPPAQRPSPAPPSATLAQAPQPAPANEGSYAGLHPFPDSAFTPGASGYKVSMGESTGEVLSGLGSFAKIAVNAGLHTFFVTHVLQPHSMERFNRGMASEVGVDVFLAEPIRAQCRSVDGMM